MSRSKIARSKKQPAWGQGNSQKARRRRRLREAQEAGKSSRITTIRASPGKRLKHSAVQGQKQRPLDYGVSAKQSELLAESPTANLNPRPNMLKPHAKPHNPDVIDLTGDEHLTELSGAPAYDPRGSNWRQTAGELAGALGNTMPNDQARALPVIELVSPGVVFNKADECFGFNGRLEPWNQGISPYLQSCGVTQNPSSFGTDKPLFSFGQDNQQPLRFDVAAKEMVGLEGHSAYGQTQQAWQTQKGHEINVDEPSSTLGQSENLVTHKSARTSAPFGEPQKPTPGFLRVAWVRQDPETLANWTPRNEKSLEDLYNEYPEKRLRSIEPDTLELVAKTIQQITEEAANNWIKSSCPKGGLDDCAVNVGSFCHFDTHSLQSVKTMVKSLLISSRALIEGAELMTLVALVRIIDQSIIICQMVKDDKRCVLLQQAKEKVEWLPVGLDCKKLDVQRRTIGKLEEHRIKARKQLVQAKPAKRAKRIAEGDIRVLDWALVEFQEHRLQFVVEMFKLLKKLLEATA